MKAVACAGVLIFGLFGYAAFAGAQDRFDFYFALGTAHDGSTHEWIDIHGSGTPLETPSMDGLFGTLGGGVMLTPSFGLGGQVLFRFAQGDYAGLKYRPVFYDFNVIWTPRLSEHVMPEFQAGFGGLHLRFYNPSTPYYDYYTGQYSTYVGSRNHLQLHAGAGLRIFVSDHIFIRPHVDYHWVRNMTEFKSSSVPAYSLAIGYSTLR